MADTIGPTRVGAIDFDLMDGAARSLHGYTLYRSILKGINGCKHSLEQARLEGRLDDKYMPRTITAQGWRLHPEMIVDVSLCYGFLKLSHEFANRSLQDAHRTSPAIAFLKAFDYEITGESGHVAVLSRGTHELKFRNLLEKAARGHPVIRIISPTDHYYDTMGLYSVVDKDHTALEEIVKRKLSFGYHATAQNWKDAASAILDSCPVVVVNAAFVGTSLIWELDEIRKRKLQSRTLIVIPAALKSDTGRFARAPNNSVLDAPPSMTTIWSTNLYDLEIKTLADFCQSFPDFPNIAFDDIDESELHGTIEKITSASREHPHRQINVAWRFAPDANICKPHELRAMQDWIVGQTMSPSAGSRSLPYIATLAECYFLISILRDRPSDAGKAVALMTSLYESFGGIFHAMIEADHRQRDANHGTWRQQLAKCISCSVVLREQGLLLFELDGNPPEASKVAFEKSVSSHLQSHIPRFGPSLQDWLT